MKIDTNVVNAVILLLVLVPYALFIFKAKHETSSLKKKFDHLAQLNNLNLEWLDSWNRNLVGIDIKKNKLLLVQQIDAVVVHVVDLRTIGNSSILSEYKYINKRSRKDEILQIIILRLEGVDGEITDIILYDHNRSYCQENELLHAQKLNEVIQNLLSFKPTISSAA